MFVSANKIRVPEEHRAHVFEGFRRALPAMKQYSGFLGLELWTAEDGSVLAISRWTSKEAMGEYTNSDMFKAHHPGASGEPDPDLVTHYNVEVLGE
ncbi:MAG TPA: antibiotic biosynthesis monooxygenase [Dictyobacter sp.]|jgi:heme-degrading monooxygenase HmoA|nr:antibiotic biosynthesis monooxygenase [Dictyobacter sp.]